MTPSENRRTHVILINPAIKTGYMHLTNQASLISQDLQTLISDQPLPTIPSYAADPAEIAATVGIYTVQGQAGEANEFTIKSFDGLLGIYNQGSWQRLFATSAGNFALYDGTYPIGTNSLTLTQQGNQVTGFILRMSGADGSPAQDLTCERVPAASSAHPKYTREATSTAGE
jgi:hypothetical protein